MLRSWTRRGKTSEKSAEKSTQLAGLDVESPGPSKQFWTNFLGNKENGLVDVISPVSPEPLTPGNKRASLLLSPGSGSALTEKDGNSNSLHSKKNRDQKEGFEMALTSPARDLFPCKEDDSISTDRATMKSETTGSSASEDCPEATSENNATIAAGMVKEVKEKLNASLTENGENDEDPYEWAYDVWRKKGLLLGNGTGNVKRRPLKKVTKKIPSGAIAVLIGGIEDKVSQQMETNPDFEPTITPKESFSTFDFNEKLKRDRLSLPAATVSVKKPKAKEESFANILKKWRVKSDDRPNSHFLSPEQLTPWGSRLEKDHSDEENVDTELEKKIDAHKDQRSPSAHKSRAPKLENELPAFRPISQASKLKDQYIRQRIQSSRGRAPPKNRDMNQQIQGQEPQELFRQVRSAPKSHGDFKTAVQQVLSNVQIDNAQNLRAASAPRQRTPLLKERATPQPSYSTANDETNSKKTVDVIDLVDRPHLSESDARREVRQTVRSKSAPRSARRPQLLRSLANSSCRQYFHDTDADGGDNEDLSNNGDPKDCRRVKDLLHPFHDPTAFSVYGDEASIPSQVEILGDDCGLSVADSRLTEMRTDYDSPESSSRPHSQGITADSPWTHSVVSKLNQIPSSGGRDRISIDRPWRHDKLVNRVETYAEQSRNVKGSEAGVCTCSASVFSDKDELIEFFLPLMGSGCTCGKMPQGLRNPEEPSSLENILRPWQVSFLAGFGIHRGDQLVKAHHRSAGALATALRQYRKKKSISAYRTKSCAMALQIWSKTCKAFVRSIRKQLTAGTVELKLPNTLYILSSFLEKLPVDGNTQPYSISSVASNASSSVAWSVTHSRTPPVLRPRRASVSGRRPSSPIDDF